MVDAASKKGVFIASKVTASMGLSYYISKELTKKILANAVVKKIFRYTTSAEFTLLSIQGLLYQAGAASDKLQKKFPIIFMEMRSQNLDMIYFLIEKPMVKYLEAIRLVRMGMPIEIGI